MKYLYLILSLFTSCVVFSQVGINVNEPQTTIHINASNANNPSSTDGVIIPIVKSLNTTDPKPNGLLVFLDSENPLTDEIEKGFHWWNGTEWIPFFSMNKLKPDQTLTYVSATDNFTGGNITENSTGTRKIRFNAATLKTNDVANFEVNNFELVVKKAGVYHLQSNISLKSVTNSDPQARESYEAKILVNGVEPTPPNIPLRTADGFPNGGTTFDSNSVISGVVKLNVGDRLSIEINRHYRDTGTTVTITPNGSRTDLTLRYMGDFSL